MAHHYSSFDIYRFLCCFNYGETSISNEQMKASWLIMIAICGCANSRPVSGNYEQEFQLASIMEENPKTPARSNFRDQIMTIEADGLRSDHEFYQWKDSSELLSMRPISINVGGEKAYLVYPTHYLPTLCGAHSIDFWIFDKSNNLIMSAREDGFRTLRQVSNGYYDIEVFYNKERHTYAFDGSKYQWIGK